MVSAKKIVNPGTEQLALHSCWCTVATESGCLYPRPIFCKASETTGFLLGIKSTIAFSRRQLLPMQR